VTTPSNVQFSRDNLFLGGPEIRESITAIRVEDRAGTVLYRFTNMLVQVLQLVDAERTQYLISSNASVKLYTFNRSVVAANLQALLIDGSVKSKFPEEDLQEYRQDGLPQLMWLYENELKMTRAVRRQRRIVFEIKGFDYEVLITQLSPGIASGAEWIPVVNFELLVLDQELLNPGSLERPRIPTASVEVAHRSTTARGPNDGTVGGLAGAVPRLGGSV